MAWIYLLIAGLTEIAWAVGLKYTEGFSRLWPTVFTLISMAISFALLAKCMKTLPVGTAYAVWTGIGTVGTLIFGILLFHENVSAPQILCVCLIVSGIVGLRLLAGQ